MADEKKPKERIVIEIAALRKEFGKEEGDRKYRELSNALGGGAGSGIVTPLAEHERDLSLAGITPTLSQQVEVILASKGE